MKTLAFTFLFTALITAGCKGQPSAEVEDKEAVLTGRHLSEHQAVAIAAKQLPAATLQCEFKDGMWEISTAQKNVWGVSSAITNTDAKITITSTNATKLVLRVRDADGNVEKVK